MANYIRIPLKDTTITTAGGPKYGLINVSNVYDVEASGSDEHIRFYTNLPADTNDVQVYIVEYYANGGGTTVVTSQDLENLRNKIVEANQNPGSNPIFQLDGAATAAAADLEDYQADAFLVSSITPI